MKMVITDPRIMPCDMAKALLEASGIACLLKNEHGSATTGIGWPIPGMPTLLFAWPEVWVDDADYVEASRILAEVKARVPLGGAPWTCGRCGESVDAELAACWNCDTARADAVNA